MGEFLRNCWQVAALSTDLEAPFVAREISGDPVILYRSASGPVALADLCPHRLVPLSAGQRCDDEIVCGYHGMRFDPQGICTSIPGRGSPMSSANVRSYPVAEMGGLIWVWMGEADLADTALLPALPWLNDSQDWRTIYGYAHFPAAYRLLNDNLLDLSHESFVHPSSIGNGIDEVIAKYPARVSDNGRVLCAERLMPDIAVPPAFVHLMGLDADARIDRSQRALFAAPGLNLTESIMKPRAHGLNRAFTLRSLHLLTPESARSTHYFYAISRNYALDNEDVDAAVERSAETVFAEDRAILTQQQTMLDRYPNTPVPQVAWAIDEAPVRGRRMLDALAAAESADQRAVLSRAQLLQD